MVPDSIRIICIRYRELFSSDIAMGQSLGVGPAEVGGMLKGIVYPTITAMIHIQAELRQLALDMEKADLFGSVDCELLSRKKG